jgi:hypothetical protein
MFMFFQGGERETTRKEPVRCWLYLKSGSRNETGGIMIIFRTADDMMGAIHVAQVFDKHGLCVVSMVPILHHKTDVPLPEARILLDVIDPKPRQTIWLIVGQGAEEVDTAQINQDIAEAEKGPKGYAEEEPEG